MSMMSHYRLNVSHNGVHLFATEPSSCRDDWAAKKVYRELRARFPESEGFAVDVTRWEGFGQHIDTSSWGW